MNKTAVIDIGSNSVRLMMMADGKVLYKTLNTTRLGEGIASSPFLKDEAISRTASAVADFFSRAKREGVEIAVFAAEREDQSLDILRQFVRLKTARPLSTASKSFANWTWKLFRAKRKRKSGFWAPSAKRMAALSMWAARVRKSLFARAAR